MHVCMYKCIVILSAHKSTLTLAQTPSWNIILKLALENSCMCVVCVRACVRAYLVYVSR